MSEDLVIAIRFALISKEIEKLQAEIQQLQEQLKEAIEVIEFYGKKETYVRSTYSDIAREITIEDCDTQEKYAESCGGKLARQFLAKIKKES